MHKMIQVEIHLYILPAINLHSAAAVYFYFASLNAVSPVINQQIKTNSQALYYYFSLSLSFFLSLYLSLPLSIFLFIYLSLSHGSRHEQLLSILFFTINEKNAFFMQFRLQATFFYYILQTPFRSLFGQRTVKDRLTDFMKVCPLYLYLYLYLSPFLYFLL